MALLSALLAWVLLYRIFVRMTLDHRAAFFHASTYWGLALFVITEGLSLPHWLTSRSVTVAWMAFCAGCLAVPKRKNEWKEDFRLRLRRVAHTERMALVGIGCLLIIVCTTALVSAPNVWDAMEYHLPRVIMWMSNKSVAFYPTPDYLQLVFAPWSEYAMMHLHLLWGSDRLVNMVEYFSFVGSVLGASWIARLLGAGIPGQVFAAAVCATIPQAALEASGPMNTCAVSFWILAALGFLIAWKQEPTWLNANSFGIASGLALLTKGTAFIYLPPLCLAVCLSYPGKLRWKFVKHAFAAAALALLISAPHMMRCYSLSGSPFGFPLPDGGARMMVRVKHVGLGVTAANIVRNVSLNINPPGNKLTELAQKATRKVISLMGQDPDDQSAIWIGSAFQLNHFSPNEIHAGNPLHLLLLLLACGWAIRRGWHGEKRSPFLFAFGLISAFVLFSALMRWQEWNSRYFVTLFVLGAGLIGLFMETRRSRKVSIGVVFVLLTSTSLYALFNRYRSLIPASQVVDIYHSRAELYFSDQHRAFAADTIAMADEINRSGCRELAVDSYFPEVDWTSGVTPRSLWVYPLFALIHADGSYTRLRYISVHNLSARFAVDSSRIRPCAVICLSCAKIPEKWEQYNQPDTRTSVHGENALFQYFPK
jgi:hypothetical protein